MIDEPTDRKQRLYITTVRVLQHLIERPMGTTELAAALHIHRQSILLALRFLRAHGLVYTGGWRRTSGAKQPIYHAGRGEDVAEPESLTAKEKRARWVARGGEPDRSKKLAREAKKIQAAGTLAGLLQINHRRTSTNRKKGEGRGKTTAPVTDYQEAA